MRRITDNRRTCNTIGQAWPIGAVFLSAVSTDPSALLGFGTWQQIGKGRAIVGVDTQDSDFNAAEKTGGAKTHVLTSNEMPSHTHSQNSHNHTQDAHGHTQNSHSHVEQLQGGTSGTTTGTHLMGSAATGGSLRSAGQSTTAVTATNQTTVATNQAATATNQNTGGGAAHNNLQPYIALFIWKRIA